MRLGALLAPSDGKNPNGIADEARALEAAGYESIWSAQAIGRGFMMHDPLIALSVVATVTEKVELGTAILQLPLYHSTDIALKVFSLDQISGGRLLIGLGAGSTETDYLVHRQAFKSRFSVFNESLIQLRDTLSDGSAASGHLTPWPAVTGGPSLLVGTWGKNVERAAKEFDGWIASGMHRTPEACAGALKVYRSAGGQRAIVSTIRVMPETDLGALGETLLGYQEAGFDDAVVLCMPGVSIDRVRALI